MEDPDHVINMVRAFNFLNLRRCEPSTRHCTTNTTLTNKSQSTWSDRAGAMIAVLPGTTTEITVQNTVCWKICDSRQHPLTVAKSRTGQDHPHATTAETTAEENARRREAVQTEADHLHATTEASITSAIVTQIEVDRLQDGLVIGRMADRTVQPPKRSREEKDGKKQTPRCKTPRCRACQRMKTRKLR